MDAAARLEAILRHRRRRGLLASQRRGEPRLRAVRTQDLREHLGAVWAAPGSAPFDAEQTRLELLALINKIPGVSLAAETIDRFPSIPLSVLAALPEAVKAFERALERIERSAGATEAP
jgi:hypothetical protein